MSRERGVTLIELVMVIVITGIIASVVAVFIRRPVEGYVDSARRAQLTDEADTALRRITRDLRLALPNSIRVDASGKFVEYIETSGGGRYRAEVDSAGGGDPLNFAAADSSFDVIGPAPTMGAGDQVVVYNLFSTGTTSNAHDPNPLTNNRTAGSVAGSTVSITSKQFPAPSPGKRFHVVTGPVTYGCTGGQLVRYSGYAYSLAQVAPPAGAATAVLAGNVNDSQCQFVYTTSPASERLATVSLVLQIERDNEKVRLFQQAHVSNVP